jgi:hypothetical protein
MNYRSHTTAASAAAVDALTIDVPAGVEEGDKLLAVLTMTSDATADSLTDPAGWTGITTAPFGSPEVMYARASWFDVPAGFSTTEYTWTVSSGTATDHFIAGAIFAFRGALAGANVDFSGWNPAESQEIETTVDNAVLVLVSIATVTAEGMTAPLGWNPPLEGYLDDRLAWSMSYSPKVGDAGIYEGTVVATGSPTEHRTALFAFHADGTADPTPGSRLVSWLLEVDWSLTGTYVDESSRLISALGSSQLANPEDALTGGRGIIDTCTLTLSNHDGRYSPLNTAGALYASLAGGGAYHAPMRLGVSLDGAAVQRIFTGVVKLPVEVTATAKAAGRVTLQCRSRDETLLNARSSTLQATFAAIHDEQWTEEEVIAAWLTAAGLTDGTDFVSQAWYTANPGTPASLDPGFWRLDWAWLEDESPLEDIWALAASTGGRFYCDENGLYRYENAAHWLQHTSAVASYTKSSFSEIAARYNDRNLYSGVTVEASPRTLLESDTIWESNNEEEVGAGQTRTITAQLRQPVYGATTAVYTGVTAGGVDMTAWLTVTLTEYAQRIEIEVENTHTTHAVILAVLYLTGTTVDGGPTLEEKVDSADAFWTTRLARRKQVRANPYVQNSGQAGFVAEFLRDRFELPRLTFAARNVPGDPVVKMGERVTLTDVDLMTTPRDGFVIAKAWRLGRSGYRMDLELVDASTLYPYESDPAYFVVGTNKIGNASTSTLPGKLFY